MSLRVRPFNGGYKFLCAAKHEARNGDTYIDDGLHYFLTVACGLMKENEDGEWEFTDKCIVDRMNEHDQYVAREDDIYEDTDYE